LRGILCKLYLNFILVCGYLFVFSLPGFAQVSPIIPSDKPNPNLDRFPQILPSPEPLSPGDILPIIPVPDIEQFPNEVPEVNISVRQIEVIGSTVISEEDIATITKSVEGRNVTLKELINVVNDITRVYINRGYITSRAVLVDQTITDGVFKILVIEGSLEKIEVEGSRRLNSSYVRSRIQLGAGTPLKAENLESQLRLLKADPLFTNIEATLKPGTEVGKSILVVRVTEANAISGSVSIDNYSTPSVGSERLGGVLNYRNITGLGDELTASYYRSTVGGANSFDFSYRVPVNALNGTIQLRYAPSDSKIIEGEIANKFDITSNNKLYEISYRQPIVRKPDQEFALSLGFAIQDGQTFLDGIPVPFGNGADERGNSKTRVLKFGQDYLRRDFQGAWILRSQFSFGLDVLDVTKNSEPIPDGRFLSWLGQIQRVQSLNRDNLLVGQAEIQLTPDSLLSSQQFVIGGGQSLRGYRQNARTGDNGFRVSLENRTVLQRDKNGLPNLQLVPFVDIGGVWNSKKQTQEETFLESTLASTGLGLIWEPIPQLLIKLDYALPLIELKNRGENAQDKGFNFYLGYSF
jgi:hemolysin activation/secretion protein